MIEGIVNDLKKMSPEQLKEVHRVIQAYQFSLMDSDSGLNRGKLHFEKGGARKEPVLFIELAWLLFSCFKT